MKIYAQFDAAGIPTGFWNDDVFPESENGDRHSSIPDDVVSITTGQWRALIDNPGRRRWKDGHVAPYEPPGPTPEELAMAARKAEFPNLFPDQFWFGLRAAGYEDDVRAWVDSMNDPESPIYNPVEWAAASAKLDYATFFERDHPLVEAAREHLGISEMELDALWKFAAGVGG